MAEITFTIARTARSPARAPVIVDASHSLHRAFVMEQHIRCCMPFVTSANCEACIWNSLVRNVANIDNVMWWQAIGAQQVTSCLELSATACTTGADTLILLATLGDAWMYCRRLYPDCFCLEHNTLHVRSRCSFSQYRSAFQNRNCAWHCSAD